MRNRLRGAAAALLALALGGHPAAAGPEPNLDVAPPRAQHYDEYEFRSLPADVFAPGAGDVVEDYPVAFPADI